MARRGIHHVLICCFNTDHNGHKKHLRCYGSVEIGIFSHQKIQDLTGKWLYVRSLELK